MAGIYVHIPYCKQACHYCDFHFSTNIKTRDELLTSLLTEIELRSGYLNDQLVVTIYFGGGTPSILTPTELERIISSIRANFNLAEVFEFTLEANPDDISRDNLQEWKNVGINRLSIGIQSLNDDYLRKFNRAHTSADARKSVQLAQESGFDNLSIDMIFGIPGQSLSEFKTDLQNFLRFDTNHISIYGLTIEDKTAFGKWARLGKLEPIDEEIVAGQFELIMSSLQDNGYLQYEISNFAKPGFESLHNSNYWSGKNYIGIGPGAHSFNGESRQYNVANNNKYIKFLQQHVIPAEVEFLDDKAKINEYILTRIRTSVGINYAELEKQHRFDFLNSYKMQIQDFLADGLITSTDHLKLTTKGKLLADRITESFFVA